MILTIARNAMQGEKKLSMHEPLCPCNNADERGCFLIGMDNCCVSCTCNPKVQILFENEDTLHDPLCSSASSENCECYKDGSGIH
jgi:hypothetical protein